MSNYKFFSLFGKTLCLISYIFSNVFDWRWYSKTIPFWIYYKGEDYISILSKEDDFYICSYFKFENRTKMIYLVRVSSRYARLSYIKMCWKLLNDKDVKLYKNYNLN